MVGRVEETASGLSFRNNSQIHAKELSCQRTVDQAMLRRLPTEWRRHPYNHCFHSVFHYNTPCHEGASQPDPPQLSSLYTTAYS